eukprot:750060-Hanusia_phi.AAC.2
MAPPKVPERALEVCPRRKLTDMEKDIEPVLLTRKMLEGFYGMPLCDVATTLSISLSAIRKACRRLGIEKWPFKSRNPGPKRKSTKVGGCETNPLSAPCSWASISSESSSSIASQMSTPTQDLNMQFSSIEAAPVQPTMLQMQSQQPFQAAQSYNFGFNAEPAHVMPVKFELLQQPSYDEPLATPEVITSHFLQDPWQQQQQQQHQAEAMVLQHQAEVKEEAPAGSSTLPPAEWNMDVVRWSFSNAEEEFDVEDETEENFWKNINEVIPPTQL